MKRLSAALVSFTLAACSGSSVSTAPDEDADGNPAVDASHADAGHAGRHDASAPHEDAGNAHVDSGVDAGRDAKTTEPEDAGTVACGCDGKTGCAVWKNVYMTWYGYNDNSCGSEPQHGCNDIADPGLGPKMHQGATAGAGTYDDPSTCAASDTMDQGHMYEKSGGVTLTPGTLIYNPEVQQYFIYEDSCLECGDEYACKLSPDDTDDPTPPSDCVVGQNLHIDFWMGPNDATQPSSLGTCEDNATIGNPYAGTGTIVVNPPPNLPVKVRTLYAGTSGGTGGCFTSTQVNGDSCP